MQLEHSEDSDLHSELACLICRPGFHSQSSISTAAEVPRVEYFHEELALSTTAECFGFASVPGPDPEDFGDDEVLQENVGIFLLFFVDGARMGTEPGDLGKTKRIRSALAEPDKGSIERAWRGHFRKRTNRLLNPRVFEQNVKYFTHLFASLQVVLNSNEVLNELDVAFVEEPEEFEFEVGPIEHNDCVFSLQLRSLLDNEAPHSSNCSALETQVVKLASACALVVSVL